MQLIVHYDLLWLWLWLRSDRSIVAHSPVRWCGQHKFAWFVDWQKNIGILWACTTKTSAIGRFGCKFQDCFLSFAKDMPLESIQLGIKWIFYDVFAPLTLPINTIWYPSIIISVFNILLRSIIQHCQRFN